MRKITDIKKLQLIANTVRQDVIKMLVAAGSGHSAGPLGIADILVALYFNVLHHKPEDPSWAERDRLVLSNGHTCPALYATMAEAGYFPVEELMTLRKFGSKLQGHPHRPSLQGIETTSGPLGSGLSQSVGMALAAKIDNKKIRVYCITSDGEHDCGNTWEGILLAAKYKLNNLCVIVDRNNIQIDGFTEDVLPLEPLRQKYEAFNWHVLEVDGHNMRHIIDVLEESKTIFEKPTVIIAHTIPGKGVSFIEKKYEWHGKPPTKEEAEKALKELEKIRSRISGDKHGK